MSATDSIVCELSVCVDCMFAHANGEINPDRPADEPAAWSRIEPGYSVTMGGDHNESCENHAKWIGAECDCGDLGFSWSSCDGCGSALGGDRYRFTLWAPAA